MHLADYMEAKGLDDAAVGAQFGKSRVTISRYRRKLEPIPSPLVKAMVEWSQGAMTANELVGIEQSEAAQ